MSRVIGLLLSQGGRLFVLFIFIVALLLAADRLYGEWQEMREARDRLSQSGQELAALELQREDTKQKLEEAEHRHSSELADQVRVVVRRMQGLKPRIEDAAQSYLDLEQKYLTMRGQASELGVELGNIKERLEWLRNSVIGKIFGWALSKRTSKEIEELTARAAELSATLESIEQQYNEIGGALQQSSYSALAAEFSALEKRRSDLGRLVSPEVEQLQLLLQLQSAEADRTRQQVEQDRRKIDEDPREQAIATIKSKFVPAAMILVGIIALPKLIKVFFYYGLAPLASRLPPIRISPASFTGKVSQVVSSGVSIDVHLTTGQELLVHSDFMQSTSQEAIKSTKWLLNAKLPLSSIASGMYFLTRIVPNDVSGTTVVVSSRLDPLSEVSAIEVPEGASIVVQPRSLAGVVKPAGRPVLITRHWRLSSLHAWLTLQFRYLVFHGPCHLIFRGCRGVRSEVPDESKPRLINQAASMGFSATLGYQTFRNETFWPYFFGKETLFNDVFSGTDGRFFYEELPTGGRRGAIAGRGLEGVVDAFLKAFGI